MILLRIPLPPAWEDAVGWAGGDEARWLAGCWTSLGSSPDPVRTRPLVDERRRLGLAGVGSAPPCRPAPGRPSILGLSDVEGRHALLIDRTGRQVYSADKAEAAWFVREQWPAAEAVVLTQDELDAVLEEVRRELEARPGLPTVDQLVARMRDRSVRVTQIMAWLDAWQTAGEES